MINNDTPITSFEEDFLNRKEFISQINKIIEKYDKKHSLTIGLEGSWGSGKTSFLNLLTNEFKNKNIKIVKFNPWNCAEGQNIQEIFFNELLSQIKKQDSKTKIHDKIKKYQYILSPAIDISSTLIQNTTGLPINNIKDEISAIIFNSDSPSIYELKKSLNDELNKLDYKILVIIDDIDRLTDENIRIIFNLTASIANFDNIIYILAYDKQVVLKALEESQRHSNEEYLEKIVQLPITIPKITYEEIELIFRLYLKKLVDDSLITLEEISHLNNYYYLISDYFENIRDIKRYFNLILLYLPIVKNEVDIIDFMLITVIQIYENEVYHLIKNSPKYMLYGKKTSKIGNEYDLFSTEKSGFYQVLYTYFKNNKKLELLLFNIFPKIKEIYEKNYNLTLSEENCTKRLISCPYYFDNYFIFGVSELDVSDNELDKLLDYTSDEIINELRRYLHLNMKEKLIRKLRLRSKNIGIANSKKIIKAVLVVSDEFDYYPYTNFLLLDYLENLNLEERYNFLKLLITDLSFNYSTFNLIYGEFFKNQKHEDCILDEEKLKDIVGIYLEKLDTYTIDLILDNQYCFDLLTCLKVMADETYFKDFISKCISNKDNLFKFIKCFNRVGYEQLYNLISIRGNKTGMKLYFDYQNMCKIIDVNLLKDKLNEISDEELTDEEKKLKKLFFNEYTQNK